MISPWSQASDACRRGAPVPTYDLLISHARVRGHEQLCTVAVAAGLIAAIDEADAEAATVLDADGQLLLPSFVDAHLHLDKVYTFERAGDAVLSEYTGAAMAGAMTAIEIASRVKDDYAQDTILDNARRAVLDGLRNGVTHVQAFADTDTAAGWRP